MGGAGGGGAKILGFLQLLKTVPQNPQFAYIW